MQNVTCPNITYMFCASFYSAPAKYGINSDNIYTNSYTPFAYKANSNHEFVPFSVNCQIDKESTVASMKPGIEWYHFPVLTDMWKYQRMSSGYGWNATRPLKLRASWFSPSQLEKCYYPYKPRAPSWLLPHRHWWLLWSMQNFMCL